MFFITLKVFSSGVGGSGRQISTGSRSASSTEWVQFKDSQDYTEKPCLEKPKPKTKQKSQQQQQQQKTPLKKYGLCFVLTKLLLSMGPAVTPLRKTDFSLSHQQIGSRLGMGLCVHCPFSVLGFCLAWTCAGFLQAHSLCEFIYASALCLEDTVSLESYTHRNKQMT